MKRFGLILISTVFAFGFGSADAATTRIKIATLAPSISDYAAKLGTAGAEIKERTEGRVQLKVYYGGVKGSATKVKQLIRINSLQGGDFTPTDFQDKMPNLNIYGLPFVFESLDEVDYVRKHMDGLIAEGFAKEGYVTFGFAGDFAIILSNSPVRGLADLKGRKIWLPEGDAISDQAMKKLRLVPNSTLLSDVLIGLRTGLFDVVAMPPAAAVLLQFHTAVKYFTDMPVIYAMQFMAISKKTFDKIDAADQVVVREVLTRVYREIGEQSPADAVNAKEALVNSGIQSIVPDSGEFDRIKGTMAINNRDMAKQGMFSLELLEQMQRYIDEYRSNHIANQLPATIVDETASAAAAGSQ
jgi:TRAP-type C4-dicarboxylate transport system substrate-binding protein